MDSSDESSSSLSTSALSQVNFRLLVLDILWFGLALPSTARFLSVYAIRLDASPLLLGWLAALPAMVALITSSLAGWWRSRHRELVPAMFWPGLGFRLVFLLPALTPFFPARWQPIWLVCAVALPAIPQGISSVLFLVLLRRGVETRQLTALMSRRSLIFNIAVGLSTLAWGLWLKHVAFPHNYQLMFVGAFALSLVSLLSVQRVQVLGPDPAPPTDHAPIQPWRSPAFRRVVFITVITHVSFFSIIAIIPLRLVDELGADEEFMSIFAVAELSAAALAAWLTDRTVRRFGSLPTIAIGLVGTGLSGLILATTSSLPVTLIAAALSGGSWTLAAISLFNYFSENTPAESLTRFSTVYNQVVLLSVFVGPMFGSQLASTPLSLTTVLMVGAVLRLVAGGMISLESVGRIGRVRRQAPAAE